MDITARIREVWSVVSALLCAMWCFVAGHDHIHCSDTQSWWCGRCLRILWNDGDLDTEQCSAWDEMREAGGIMWAVLMTVVIVVCIGIPTIAEVRLWFGV